MKARELPGFAGVLAGEPNKTTREAIWQAYDVVIPTNLNERLNPGNAEQVKALRKFEGAVAERIEQALKGLDVDEVGGEQWYDVEITRSVLVSIEVLAGSPEEAETKVMEGDYSHTHEFEEESDDISCVAVART